MKEFTIKIENEKPVLMIENRKYTDVDWFCSDVLNHPIEIDSIVRKEFRRELGYFVQWNSVYGDEPERIFSNNVVWTKQKILAVKARIQQALESAQKVHQ